MLEQVLDALRIKALSGASTRLGVIGLHLQSRACGAFPVKEPGKLHLDLMVLSSSFRGACCLLKISQE